MSDECSPLTRLCYVSQSTVFIDKYNNFSSFTLSTIYKVNYGRQSVHVNENVNGVLKGDSDNGSRKAEEYIIFVFLFVSLSKVYINIERQCDDR